MEGAHAEMVMAGGVKEVTIEQVTVGIEPFAEAAKR